MGGQLKAEMMQNKSKGIKNKNENKIDSIHLKISIKCIFRNIEKEIDKHLIYELKKKSCKTDDYVTLFPTIPMGFE